MAYTITTTTLTSEGSGKYSVLTPRAYKSVDLVIKGYTKGAETTTTINVIKVHSDGSQAYVGNLGAANAGQKFGITFSATQTPILVYTIGASASELYNTTKLIFEVVSTGSTPTGTLLIDVVKNKQ